MFVNNDFEWYKINKVIIVIEKSEIRMWLWLMILYELLVLMYVL